MTRKDKVGVGILIGILVTLGLILYITTDRKTGAGGDFTNNPIVERRIKTQQTTR